MVELQEVQDALDWDNIILFCNIALQWHDTQERYYRELATQDSSFQWANMLIEKLWDLLWDLWEHWNALLYQQEN
jgi:hypothetical protein